jgi:hypothetical protein
MAISVAQNPIGTQGAGGRGYAGLGDCVFRVTSSNLTQPNFKFLVEVYDSTGLAAKFVIAPNPQSMLMFNLYEIAKSFVKTDHKIFGLDQSIHFLTEVGGGSAAAFSQNETGCKLLEVRFGEKYDVAGDPTEFPGAGTLGADAWQVFFLPWLLQDNDGAYPQGLTRWTIGTAATVGNRALTDIIKGVYVHENSSEWNIDNSYQIPVRTTDYGVLAFPHDALTIDTQHNTANAYYQIWNGTTSLGTATIPISALTGAAAGTTTVQRGKLIYHGVYPANLNNTESFILNPALYPNTSNTWTHYRIQYGNSSYKSAATLYFVKVEATTCRYDNIRIGFVNQSGGWDYWNFDKKNEIDWKADGKTFRKVNGTYQAATFKKNIFERGETVFSQAVEKVYTITSDYLTEEAFEFLKGIVLSKDVHIVDTANLTHIPVTVVNKEYKQRKIRSAVVYNLTLQVKLSQTYNA